jgi:hypothetical protein
MADFIYDLARQAFLEGEVAILTADIKAVLVDGADYTPSASTDDFLADIAGGGRVATSSNFASKTSTLGVFDAADITFSTVTGDQCEYIVIYEDTGDAATSKLLAKIDSYTGLPVTPNGGNITVAFPADSNKIWKL